MAFNCSIPAVPFLQQDDDALRITRWDFAPGAVTGWHEHGYPYFVVMLEAGELHIHDGKDVTKVSLAKGQAYQRPAGIRHDVMNGSDHAISFVEIELKTSEAMSRAAS